MDQAELLNFLIDVVESRHLSYAIVGSHATIAFGESRFTNDIDVLIGLTPATLDTFCKAFPFPEFYVSEDGARTAAVKGGMFNIIHPASGLKIDVIVPAKEFDRQQLARTVRMPTVSGRHAEFASPEDIIVKKMDAYNEGGSEKHLRDIAGVLKILGDRVDRAYIADSAGRLGLQEIWQAIVNRVDS